MRPADDIYRLTAKLRLKASADLDQRVHNAIDKALGEPRKRKPAAKQPSVWRIIMQSRITKSAAAVIVVVVMFGVVRTAVFGGEQTSEPLTGLGFSLPRRAAEVEIEVLQARGKVFAADLPSEENDYELVVTFDDDQAAGADWYEVLVHVSDSSWATKTSSIYVKAYIDGVSKLVFKDNTTYWRHSRWELPGRHDGNNYATYINDVEWLPHWPKSKDASYRGEQISEVLYDLPFSVPGEPLDFMHPVAKRGEVSVEGPCEENDYQLVVTFDDDQAAGAEWYEVELYVVPKEGSDLERVMTKINIRAYVDGVSKLVFKDDTVYWHHLKWAAPGRHDGNNYPTYINDIEWVPQWQQPQRLWQVMTSGRSYAAEAHSEPLTDLAFSLPGGPVEVQIEPVQARGRVFVGQLPCRQNDHELVVVFDDGPIAGPEWYEVTVHVGGLGGGAALSIHIEAYIDGLSALVFKDNTAYWHHLTWARPGRHGNQNYPTYINDVEWMPQWP
ncbi:MAG: hypothetical protein ACYTEL_10655 [Planctomycetota bacterium]